MSKKTIAGVIFALCLYLVFLIVARTPASMVAYQLHNAMPNLWLTGVTGTAWSGLARGAQIDINGEPMAMGSFRWEVNPWALLGLKACVKFKSQFAGRPLDGDLCRSFSGEITVSSLNVEAPLNIFQKLTRPAKINGQASLQVIEAKLSDTNVSKLDARLTLQSIRVDAGTGWQILGTYAAVVSEGKSEENKGGIEAKLMDIDAPFNIDMTATWKFGQDMPKILGTVKTTEASPQDVTSVIEVFGEEKESGFYKIQWP